MLETPIMSRGTTQGGTENLTPEIKILQADNTYGKFTIEPLQRGYGMTIGNPIRRMLLSSIEGTAITWVKIDGVLHEYSNISHMREEVMEFLLRVEPGPQSCEWPPACDAALRCTRACSWDRLRQ